MTPIRVRIIFLSESSIKVDEAARELVAPDERTLKER